MAAKTIKIREKFIGHVVYTAAPDFTRNVPNPHAFVLDENLTAQELAYIHKATNGELTYESTNDSSL